MQTIQQMILEAVAGNLEKTASTASPHSLIESLEKTASSGRIDSDMGLRLIKEAAQALRRATDENRELKKLAGIRQKVDSMLDDGLITQYEVQDTVQQMLKSADGSPVSGTMFTKVADADSPTVKGQKRGMFDEVITV